MEIYFTIIRLDKGKKRPDFNINKAYMKARNINKFYKKISNKREKTGPGKDIFTIIRVRKEADIPHILQSTQNQQVMKNGEIATTTIAGQSLIARVNKARNARIKAAEDSIKVENFVPAVLETALWGGFIGWLGLIATILL